MGNPKPTPGVWTKVRWLFPMEQGESLKHPSKKLQGHLWLCPSQWEGWRVVSLTQGHKPHKRSRQSQGPRELSPLLIRTWQSFVSWSDCVSGDVESFTQQQFFLAGCEKSGRGADQGWAWEVSSTMALEWGRCGVERAQRSDNGMETLGEDVPHNLGVRQVKVLLIMCRLWLQPSWLPSSSHAHIHLLFSSIPNTHMHTSNTLVHMLTDSHVCLWHSHTCLPTWGFTFTYILTHRHNPLSFSQMTNVFNNLSKINKIRHCSEFYPMLCLFNLKNSTSFWDYVPYLLFGLGQGDVKTSFLLGKDGDNRW